MRGQWQKRQELVVMDVIRVGRKIFSSVNVDRRRFLEIHPNQQRDMCISNNKIFPIGIGRKMCIENLLDFIFKALCFAYFDRG